VSAAASEDDRFQARCPEFVLAVVDEVESVDCGYPEAAEWMGWPWNNPRAIDDVTDDHWFDIIIGCRVGEAEGE
jgi:hypothetical protein